MKTANQLWREEGKPKPFKEWLDDKKAMGQFMYNKPLNEAIWHNATGESEVVGKGQIFGLPTKTLYIFGGIILAGGIIALYLKNKRK
jgi:hypothetical protein